MRIAHVTDCYLPRLGGIEMQVHDLALRQQEAGHDVVVITSTPPAASGEVADDVPVLRLASAFGQPTVASLSEVARVVRTARFDVLHAHSSAFSALAWSATRAAARRSLPCVLTMHSVVVRPTRFLTAPLRLVASGENRPVWTAVSQSAARSLQRTVGAQQVGVLPNGIDPQQWQTPSSADGHGPLTIVSVMRLAHRKRPLALLRILRSVREQVPADIPLRAVIVGSGPMAQAVGRRLRFEGLHGWVELAGRLDREQIRDLYATADLYLAPAELESFGIAALEARCAGLPVVAMACGGVGDFVQDGVGGRLVDSDAQMAQVAAQLLTNHDRRLAMREHHRRTAPTMTWPAVLSQTMRLYAVAGVRAQPALARARRQEAEVGHDIDLGVDHDIDLGIDAPGDLVDARNVAP